MDFIKAKDTYRRNAVVQGKMAKRLVFEIKEKLGQKYEQILEIGSGTGFLTDEVFKNLEFCEIFLNDLTENYTGYSPRKFFMGNFLETKIDEKFDLILSNAVFQWIEDKEELFLKIKKLLKEGGKLCFTTFGEKNFVQIKEITGFSLDYKNLVPILKKTGFKVQYMEEELQTLYFSDVRKVLSHIRATGVGNNNECFWTKSKYEIFMKKYTENFSDSMGCELTYHPVYYICSV